MVNIKFDIEKFDGRINFGLWQVQVNDVLIQTGLHKALKGRPIPLISETDSEKSGSFEHSRKTSMTTEEWEEIDLRAASQIRLCLEKNVLANVVGMRTTKELWEKLESLYQAKSLSNRLYLKQQFYTLQMEEGTKISDHLSVLNGIVSELECIGVKIDDEDKALRLIWSLPSSYDETKWILMHGKETLNFSEVVGNLISEERILRSRESKHLEDSALVVRGKGKWKKNSKKTVSCWGCGQSGHLKRDCKVGGADSANSSNGVANFVSHHQEDDEFSF